MKTQVKCMTKKDKAGTASPTIVTLDWDGVTLDDTKPLFTDGLVIRLQSKWRRGEGAIPSVVEVRVKDACAGRVAEVVTVDSLAANANTLTPAERAALIAKLQGK
jgi:hypothetical protein